MRRMAREELLSLFMEKIQISIDGLNTVYCTETVIRFDDIELPYGEMKNIRIKAECYPVPGDDSKRVITLSVFAI